MIPFNCEVCGKQIAARRSHVVFQETRAVLHSDCTGTAVAHALVAPNCPHSWHDGWDHEHALASRAAAVYLIGSAVAR